LQWRDRCSAQQISFISWLNWSVADPPIIRAIRDKSLAAAGLGGVGVDASLIGDTLILRGTSGGQLVVPLEQAANSLNRIWIPKGAWM
jgi:hypothetical protein